MCDLTRYLRDSAHGIKDSERGMTLGSPRAQHPHGVPVMGRWEGHSQMRPCCWTRRLWKQEKSEDGPPWSLGKAGPCTHLGLAPRDPSQMSGLQSCYRKMPEEP